LVTDQELRDSGGSLTAQHAELAEVQKTETEETNRQLRETDREQRETARQLREVGRQLDKLGEKFGSFTEGMAFPAMTKILMQRFGMSTVAAQVRSRRNGRSLELDVLAYSNSRQNEAYVVEVKSHLREDGLDQLRRTLRDFREFFPEHADKKVYGILAAVDIPDNVAEKTLREGIYLARIHDNQFEIQVPDGFQPRAY
jgi:hypothetical protein